MNISSLIHNYLQAFRQGNINTLMSYYAKEAVVFMQMGSGTFQTKEEIRSMLTILADRTLSNSSFAFIRQKVVGKTAYVLWTSDSAKFHVSLGSQTMTLKKGKIIAQTFVINGFWKDSLYNIDLGPGDTAIDCGAHIGRITERMALTNATVYAFEPNPDPFKVLDAKFSGWKNVICVNKGVLDKNVVRPFYMHKNVHLDRIRWSTGASLVASKTNINRETFIEAEFINLSKFIKKLDKKIKVVKLDVEGVEVPIINNLIDTDAISYIENLLVETHESRIPEIADEVNHLKTRIKSLKLTQKIDLTWI